MTKGRSAREVRHVQNCCAFRGCGTGHCADGAGRRAAGRELPEQADPDRRLGGRRRRRRSVGAHHRQPAADAVGPAGDGREPHRRQRQHRRRSRLARGAGRLHAAGDAAQHRSPPMPRCSRSSATTRRALDAGGDHGGRPERAGGEEGLAGQDRRRADRARQGQRRQAELRLAGQRLDLASHDRAVQEPHRHPDHARALQGRGAGGERSRRRPRRHHVLRPRHDPVVAPRRPGPDHRGGDAEADRAAARDPDHRRERPARVHLDDVLLADGAARNAAGRSARSSTRRSSPRCARPRCRRS